MNTITEAAVTIAIAVIGLATISVIVSRNANTSGVLGAASKGFSQVLGAATAPVSGNGAGGLSLGYSALPSLSGGFGS